jgi:hypothetical protein
MDHIESVLYIGGLDVHERESQLAVFERDGRLLNEGRENSN